MEFVGAIDTSPDDRIAGWAVTRFGDACTVTVTVNGDSVFTTTSDGLRPDLAAKQQSCGAGGFRIDIASALRPGVNTIEVHFPDGSPVQGSPVVRRIAADWVAPAPKPALQPTLVSVPRAVPQLSASDLEDISLDDVGFAVEHGVIAVPVRQKQPAAQTIALPPATIEAQAAPAAGWLASLFRPRSKSARPTL